MPILAHLRQAFRLLARDPGIAGAAVLCLALGIGANSAIFTVAEIALLRPLPFDRPEGLVTFHDVQVREDGGQDSFRVSPPIFDAWRRRGEAFQALGAAQTNFAVLAGDVEPQRLRIAEVTHELLPVLGISPILGRTFAPDEDRPRAAARVVVLSHRLWQTAFGGEPSIVGRSILLDDQSHVVVGVMPASVRYPEGDEQPEGTDLWRPLGLDPEQLPQRLWHNLLVVGRLKPGVDVEQAQTAIDRLMAVLAAEDPASYRGWGAQVASLRGDLLGDLKPALNLLLAAAGLLLVIASVNVANLLIARSLGRQEELALRLALGESPLRITGHVFLEGSVLGLLGGALGLVLAGITMPPLLAMVPSHTTLFERVSIGPRVVLFTLLVSLASAVLFSLAPSLRFAAHRHRVVPLGPGRRASGGKGLRRAQSALVLSEVALATLLLAGASLTMQRFLDLRRVHPGFSTDGYLDLGTVFSAVRYPEAHQRTALLEQASDAIRRLPGVQGVEIASALPLADSQLRVRISIASRPADAQEVLAVNHRLISPGYFRLMGMPLIAGRYFEATDTAMAPPVAIVSEEAARRYWPGESPLGKQVKRGVRDAPVPWRTIVGVVADVRDRGPGEGFEPTWYLPMGQELFPVYHFVVRTRSEPRSMIPEVRKAIWSVDPQQPLYSIRSLDQLHQSSLGSTRFHTALLSLLAAIAVTLVLAGLYGVLSYFVNQSLSEIGVRMALGARSSALLTMFLGRALRLIVGGIVLGLGLTVLASRFLSGILFRLPAPEPASIAGTALALAAVALLVALIPALRATQIDPQTTLRAE